MALIDEYIEKCNAPDSLSYDEGKDLIREIVGTFIDEIPNIKTGLDMYRSRLYTSSVIYDVNGDLHKLKAKLRKLKEDKEAAAVAIPPAGPVFNITQTQSNDNVNHNSQTVTIELENVIDSIEELTSNGALLEEEKDILIGKLTALDNAAKKRSNKKDVWAKASGIMKWIADKGVDVGIAALPYILQALTNAPL